jgi:uncharacterized protein involved in tellurium resistance
MADTEFSTERLLEQAAGNQSALFLVALRWARERDGSVDAWATFLGDQFAEGWEEMRSAGAREVARQVGLNFACGADSNFVGLEGDDSRGEAVIEGPDAEWLADTGVSVADNDRANELIFRRIADGIGFSVETFRENGRLHIVLSKA